MKIPCKDGFVISGIKMSDVVTVACGRMNVLTDFNNSESYYTPRQFGQLCLDEINFTIKSRKAIKLKHLKHPDKFIKSCRQYFHMRKNKDLTLRSAKHNIDGWILLRRDIDTNPNDIEQVDILSRDSIIKRANKHDKRVELDIKELGVPEIHKLGVDKGTRLIENNEVI